MACCNAGGAARVDADAGEGSDEGASGEGDTLLFAPCTPRLSWVDADGGEGGGEGSDEGASGEGDTLLFTPYTPILDIMLRMLAHELAERSTNAATPPLSWVVVLELARAAKRKGLRPMRRVRSGSASPFMPTRNIPAN